MLHVLRLILLTNSLVYIRCIEQPEAIARALKFGGRMSSHEILLGGLDKNFDKVSQIRHMTICACGTSLNAARYGERLMKHLGSFDSVSSIDAAETEVNDFPATKSPEELGVIVVSQSGETKDVARVVQTAQGRGICVMSVVNAVGSLIARTTGLGVYCHAGREYAVASTKAFTTQVTVLALLALWFRNARDKLSGSKEPSVEALRLQDALMRLPISFGMALKTREHCLKIAQELLHKEHCFILGKGRFSILVWIFFPWPTLAHGIVSLQDMANLLPLKVLSRFRKCATYMPTDTVAELSSTVRSH